jgi:hypothetical protein
MDPDYPFFPDPEVMKRKNEGGFPVFVLVFRRQE